MYKRTRGDIAKSLEALVCYGDNEDAFTTLGTRSVTVFDSRTKRLSCARCARARVSLLARSVISLLTYKQLVTRRRLPQS
jgi:hypothetical protein